MSRPPTYKRMCNPAGIPDAKFFAERKRRRREPKRDKPLEGFKTTKPSEDDGVLEQLFTVHDSTTIPKPQGGRKLLHGKDDGHLAEIVSSQSRQTVCEPSAKMMGRIAITLAVLLLMVVYSTAFIKLPESVLVLGFFAFVMMHAFVLYSQLKSDGRNAAGILALAIFYPGYVIWCLIGGLL